MVGGSGAVLPGPGVGFGRQVWESGVQLVLGASLEGVDKSNGRLIALCAGGARYEGSVFVDASYEGDLMAAAGVRYRVGREPRTFYCERWAGRQPAYRPGMHNFEVVISPFRQPGSQELLAGIAPTPVDELGWPEEALGEGDGALQAYQLRLCMTDRPANQLPLREPGGYDPDRFELLRRYLAAGGDRRPAGRLLGLVPDLLPNGKCDVNSIGPFSLNVLDGSNGPYPEAGVAERAAIYEHHRRYSHELLYFLQTDGAVPEELRREFRRWALCADEFTDNEGWLYQLYVRESRRMQGTVVLTEADLLRPKPIADAVAFGSYNIDIREVQRSWRYLPEYHAEPAVFNEGYLSLAVPLYLIPYGCLLPREEEVDNVLVAICCSASHVAYGSLRTEPTLMALGEAAGTAAAMAALAGVPPARVPPASLAARLETGRRRI